MPEEEASLIAASLIVASRQPLHEPDNLIVLCEAHHTQLHEGLITITGKAPKITVARRHDPNVKPKHTKLDDITAIVTARRELVKRGYSKSEAASAIEHARIRAGERASVELLVAIAIERHPKS